MKALAGIKTQSNPNIIANIPQDVNLEFKAPTVTVVGNPTINGEVVSGFSDSNYLTIPTNTPLTTNYEIGVKIITPNTNQGDQAILNIGSTNTEYSFVYLAIANNGTNLYAKTGNNNNSNIINGNVVAPIQNGESYYVKFVITDNTSSVYVSTEGYENMTLANTVNQGSPITSSVQCKLGDDLTARSYFKGSIDLNKCYININGSRWWTGEIGTLTLKAGSKVYVPNGSGVFDMVTTAQDYMVMVGGPTGERTLFFTTEGAFFVASQSLNLYSGTTAPTPSTASAYWYDITNNLIKRTQNTGSTWNTVTGATLPIAIVTFSSGSVTSIDQVFNGFGYIGSTVFSLPGIRTLTPNGKNSDDTYKVLDITTEYVITRTWNNSTTVSYKLFYQDNFGVLSLSAYSYDSTTNYNYNNTDIYNSCLIGDISFTSGKITSLTINPVQNPYLSSPTYNFFLRGSKYKAFNYEGNINHDIIYYESLGPYNKTFTLPAGDYFIAITGGGGAGISWAYSGYPWSASGGSGATWEGIFHNPVEQSVTIVAGAKQANSYMELGGIRMITAGKGANAAINNPGAGGTLTVNNNLQIVSVQKSTNGKKGGMNTSTTASTSSYGWGKANNGAGGILLKEI